MIERKLKALKDTIKVFLLFFGAMLFLFLGMMFLFIGVPWLIDNVSKMLQIIIGSFIVVISFVVLWYLIYRFDYENPELR